MILEADDAVEIILKHIEPISTERACILFVIPFFNASSNVTAKLSPIPKHIFQKRMINYYLMFYHT